MVEDVKRLFEDARLQEATTSRVLDESARWKSLMRMPGSRRAAAILRQFPKEKSQLNASAPGRKASLGVHAKHQHLENTLTSHPPILGWSKKQYSRPGTSANWGVKPPSRTESVWSQAWTADLQKSAKHADGSEEETIFVVNPGRFHLSSSDVTSPRCTRRGFGLSNAEFCAIVEPLKTPPPQREEMLIRRHGSQERRRCKYDKRTCQMGFGLVEHAEKVSTNMMVMEKRLSAAPCQQTRVCLLDLNRHKLREPIVRLDSVPSTPQMRDDLNIPDRHKRNSRWAEITYKQCF